MTDAAPNISIIDGKAKPSNARSDGGGPPPAPPKKPVRQRYQEIAADLGLTDRDCEGLFLTSARACGNDPVLRWQYLAFAKAHDLRVLAGELHATTRNEKVRENINGRWEERWEKRLVLTTAYTVFMERALLAGWRPWGCGAVCRGDHWHGWDATACQPVQHVTATTTDAPEVVRPGDRDRVIGAWFTFCRQDDPDVRFGMYYDIDGIMQTGKEGERLRAWKDPSEGGMADHMAIKTVAERVVRMLVPSRVGTVYGDEELLGETEPDATAAEAESDDNDHGPAPLGDEV